VANSTRRKAWVEVSGKPGVIGIKVMQGTRPPDDRKMADGTVRSSSVISPACATSVPASGVREYAKKIGSGRQVYAVLDIDGAVRTYRDPTAADIEGAEHLAPALLDDLEETPDGTSPLPDEPITKSQFRILRSQVYGIDTFRGLFNDSQLYVLGSLCEAVRAAHDQMLAESPILRAVGNYARGA
jgi:putative DNA methylase